MQSTSRRANHSDCLNYGRRGVRSDRISLQLLTLTKVDPWWELASGSHVGVVPESGKAMQALVDERLQHSHTPWSSRFCPVYLTNTPIHSQRWQNLIPVHCLTKRKKNNIWIPYLWSLLMLFFSCVNISYSSHLFTSMETNKKYFELDNYSVLPGQFLGMSVDVCQQQGTRWEMWAAV